MPKYLCLQRSLPSAAADKPSQPSPEQMQAMYAQFNAWREQFQSQLTDLGGRLGHGRLVTAQPAPDGPIVEVKELVGGYMQGTALIPDGVDAARQVRFMDRICDLYLNNAVVTLLFEKFGFRKHDDAALQTASMQLRFMFDKLDARLARDGWLCGEQFSMADCAAIPPLYYAQFCAPIDEHPNLARYAERARSRPSYARVMDEFVPLWQGMAAARK